MNKFIQSSASLLLAVLALAGGCDVESAEPEVTELRGFDFGKNFDFEIEFTVVRAGAEVSIEVAEGLACTPGSRYTRETKEVIEDCVDGKIIRTGFTLLEFFACSEEGTWKHIGSACAADSYYHEETEEECGVEDPYPEVPENQCA